jgi:ATP synthase protein I
VPEQRGADRNVDRNRELLRQVGRRERRKLRARREGTSVWFGLGMYGLIGWSVAMPTVLGVALGMWLDAARPGPLSWTLMLMFGGLIAGCATAWYWVAREQRAIGGTPDDDEAGRPRKDGP